MNAPVDSAALLALKQGSPEWALARAGMITASCFSDVQAKGDRKMRTKLLRKLVAERLTGKPIESYRNAHMDRGHEQEPLARMAYEALTGNIVDEVGIVVHPRYPDIGCSPDGLVGEDGGCEIKSVIATVQIDALDRGAPSPEHRAQLQGAMWVSGRKWWHFISFCPDLPPNLRMAAYEVPRDDGYIETLATEVLRFRGEVEALVQSLIERKAA